MTNPRATPAPSEGCAPSPALVTRAGGRVASSGRRGIYDDVDSAVKAARAAHEHLIHKMTLKGRDRCIAALRQRVHDVVQQLATMAVEETRLGRVDDKVNKNLLVADKTPGTEILRPIAQSGDDGLMLIERAPYGVIGAITPTTNPTETIICNSIGMIAAGNSVVFNVPTACGDVRDELLAHLACTKTCETDEDREHDRRGEEHDVLEHGTKPTELANTRACFSCGLRFFQQVGWKGIDAKVLAGIFCWCELPCLP